MHIACCLLELAEHLCRVIDEEVLVHDVVAGEQHSDRCGKREAAIATICRETLVTAVGSHACRQVFGIGERMQAEVVVANLHLASSEGNVLQAGGILLREREVFLDDART